MKHLLAFVLLLGFQFCQSKNHLRNHTPESGAMAGKDELIGVDSTKFPVRIGAVNDFERSFTSAEVKYLDSLLGRFNSNSVFEIVLVTLDSLSFAGHDFYQYTLDLANTWKVGGVNSTGIVVAISVSSRMIQIQNGRTTEKYLSDQETANIVDSVFLPAFRDGDYFVGMKDGVSELVSVLEVKAANIQ
jgi:uncharacterized protein